MLLLLTVKPQPVNSPYKKPTVIVSSTPNQQSGGAIYNKPRMSPMPVVMPRAPDGSVLPSDFRQGRPDRDDNEKINNDALDVSNVR